MQTDKKKKNPEYLNYKTYIHFLFLPILLVFSDFGTYIHFGAAVVAVIIQHLIVNNSGHFYMPN